MNRKGVLFTMMVLLLTLGILALNAAIEKGMTDAQQLGYVTSFLRVSEKYNNVERNLIRLDKNSAALELNQRIIPFVYVLKENSLSITQELPIKSSDFDSYYDAINIYEIFEEDANYSRAYTGLNVSADTLQNSNWGGTSTEISFLIEPFCFQVRENGLSNLLMEASGSGKCTGIFNIADIRRFDANVIVKQFAEDYNAMKCDGGSCDGTGWHQAFDPGNSSPFFELEINDSNCGKCALKQANKKLSMHYDSAQTHKIEIYCQGTCTSDPIIISFSDDLNVIHISNERVVAEIKTEFKKAIQKFYFLGFDVSVRENDFNVLATNREDFS